jgi:hypothetical protein
MVVRDDKVLLRSKEQQRGFNFPYQLGTSTEFFYKLDLL